MRATEALGTECGSIEPQKNLGEIERWPKAGIQALGGQGLEGAYWAGSLPKWWAPGSIRDLSQNVTLTSGTYIYLHTHVHKHKNTPTDYATQTHADIYTTHVYMHTCTWIIKIPYCGTVANVPLVVDTVPFHGLKSLSLRVKLCKSKYSRVKKLSQGAQISSSD